MLRSLSAWAVLVFLAGIASAARGDAPERECLDNVPELCLVTEKRANGARLSVVNASAVPYTVRVFVS